MGLKSPHWTNMSELARDIAAAKYANGDIVHERPFCQYFNCQTGQSFRLIGSFDGQYTEGWTFQETITTPRGTWAVYTLPKS